MRALLQIGRFEERALQSRHLCVVEVACERLVALHTEELLVVVADGGKDADLHAIRVYTCTCVRVQASCTAVAGSDVSDEGTGLMKARV